MVTLPEFSRARSLPLMGIGNRVGRVKGRHRLELITPHGDREPGTVKSTVSCLNAHYPMGIGNWI